MERIGIDQLRQKVSEEGSVIRWVGETASESFCVVFQDKDGSRTRFDCDPMSWPIPQARRKRIGFAEADADSQKVTACSPPDETVFRRSRRASVFGVNIGGDCEMGACKIYNPIRGCVMAYDIETMMDKTREGSFALNDSPILSIAAKCSCGDEFYVSRNGPDASREMVSELLSHMVNHAPLWTIGWNSYNFDNECMKIHCAPEVKNVFFVARTGAFGKPTYGSIINIPGTYNVDLQLYMVKSLYKLSSFKLGDVARDMGVTPKMKMPEMTEGTDPEALRIYNVNDCVVTLDIWTKEKIGEIIPSIALCTSSPIYDCTRYVTGTLASLGYASYSTARGYLIQWSKCSIPQSYGGGYVMEPIRGLHHNIVVCDFKSMYPTIMASCNINPHSFSTRKAVEGEESGEVKVTKHITEVCLGDTVAVFDNSEESVMSQFMRFLVEERDRHRKSLPAYAKSLKVFSNSVYGSTGYFNSTLYSPTCAAAITAIGRHCINLAKRFFMKEGLTAVYGDTDSCMVKSDGSRAETEEMVQRALDKLHEHMGKTSLHLMKMEIEAHYAKGIMTDKKRYCMLLTDGSMKKVGISLSRRDVSGLCRLAANTTIQALFMDNIDQTIATISQLVSAISTLAVQGNLTLSDVSRYVKKDGTSCYSYPKPGGGVEHVPQDAAVLGSFVQCDIGKVMHDVATEIQRFTIPCRLGSVADIMRRSSIW